MFKFLKYSALSLLVVFIALFLVVKSKSQPLPNGDFQDADEFARRIENALNKPAFDSCAFISWEYAGRAFYIWDKQNNNAVIRMGNKEVHLNLTTIDGNAYDNGKPVTGNAKKKLVSKAWAKWCNDSYWLFAPFKFFDKGTTRKLVKSEDGKTHLMVSYESGGVTPGDSYLWEVDQNFIPIRYRMWVKIIPLKGMPATWEDWETMPSGFKISKKHKIAFYNALVTNLKEGAYWEDFGYEEDPKF